jgi:hypothetical protein
MTWVNSRDRSKIIILIRLFTYTFLYINTYI